MTIFEADRDVGFRRVAAREQKESDLEALRDCCVQQMFDARLTCEEVNALHAGSEPGPVPGVHADQEDAQGLLCTAVRDLEDVDALLHQRRQLRK
ncbi:hypothetical protein IWX65_003436 [Arthrobacter sp. CAN_A214]|uniref:hypothetical protein n=1 Tax=Arthrobacter sp. CAN_A214 TaxID=2787720 RepID=UPI0018CB7880